MEKKELNEQIHEIRKMMGLNEGIEYDTEKIAGFLEEAKKSVDMGRAIIDKYGVMVVNLTMSEIYSNINGFKDTLNKIEGFKKTIESRYNKFYDIIDMYYDLSVSKDLIELDKMVTTLDDQNSALSDIHEIFGELIGKTEWLAKYNEDLLTTQIAK